MFREAECDIGKLIQENELEIFGRQTRRWKRRPISEGTNPSTKASPVNHRNGREYQREYFPKYRYMLRCDSNRQRIGRREVDPPTAWTITASGKYKLWYPARTIR